MWSARGLAWFVLAGCGLSCTEGARTRSDGVLPSGRPVPEPGTGSFPPQAPSPSVASPGAAQPACRDDGVVNVSVDVDDQAGLDRLAGCERVVGDLRLFVQPGLDYGPLRSLRDVEGTLVVLGRDSPAAELLEALRGLDEAGGLDLGGLRLDSLEPLSGLRRLGAGTSELPARPETIEKVTAPEDRDYLGSYGLSIGNCAGLTSLAGLESLEELDALRLYDNPDLVSLEGLTGLVGLPALQLRGGVVDLRGSVPVQRLSVSHSEWADLSLLGDARALESLELLDNAALESLAGALLPERLEALAITNNPALVSLAGLEALTSIEWLSIGTASWSAQEPPVASRLTSLEGLNGLERVGALLLVGQTALRSLDGLEALREIESLEISDNPALESLRALEGVERVGGVFVLRSPALVSLSGLGSARVGVLQLLEVGVVDLLGLERARVETHFGIWGAPGLVSLRGLPELGPAAEVSLNELPALTDGQALEAVTSLGSLTLDTTSMAGLVAPGLQQLRSLTVWGNPELEQLSLGALRTIEQLRVLANGSLVRLDLRRLESAQQLEIANNARLYQGSLEPLLALGAAPAVVERNGGSAVPLAPCPWSGDGLCDEASGVCAEGTDPADCDAP